jgi:hypothetical protein
LLAVGGCPSPCDNPSRQIFKARKDLSRVTSQFLRDLVQLDPDAEWDVSGNRIVGGCMASGSCVGSRGQPLSASPRLVRVLVFDPELFEDQRVGACTSDCDDIRVTNEIALFIDEQVLDSDHAILGWFD